MPPKRGLAYPDIIEGAVAGRIRALWIIATNPLVSFPNQDVLRQGLSNLDFLVVQDGYQPTPTTELADLVLPAAIWGEKEGTYTNSERRVSKVNKAVEPRGEARSDFEIFLDVGRKFIWSLCGLLWFNLWFVSILSRRPFTFRCIIL